MTGVYIMGGSWEGGDSFCPSCGRYVGSYDVCPYCGARVRTRVSLKALAIIALVISFAGIIALYYAAKHSEPPLVYVEDITGEMNYARVKMRGYAYTSTIYDDVQGKLYFRFVDEKWSYNEEFKTYSIMVFVYAPTARELIEQGKAPVSGDKVEIIGTLKVRDFISIIINEPDDLIIKRDKPKEMSFNDIKELWDSLEPKDSLPRIREHIPVKITCWVTYYGDYGTYISGEVKDYSYPGFEIQLYIPGVAMKGMPDFFLGDKIEIIGNLWEYRGDIEIIPWNGTSIKIVEKLKVTSVNDLYNNRARYSTEGRIVMVNATIVGKEKVDPYATLEIWDNESNPPEDDPIYIYIDESTWSALEESIRTALSSIGTVVLVIGQFKLYTATGMYEVAVYDPSWILDVWPAEVEI